MPRPWIVAPLVLAACAGDESRPLPGHLVFEADRAAFPAALGPAGFRPLEVLAADHDADGDLDLLVNWHTLLPMELFENTGGAFALLPDALVENRGVSSLYAEREAHLAELERAAQPGLFVWHDPNREASWHVAWFPGEGGGRCVLEANFPVEEIAGDDRPGVAFDGERRIVLDLDALAGPAALDFRVRHVATALAIEAPGLEHVRVGAGAAPIPLPASLWKPDPHGIAWIDVEGEPPPEAYVSRGGIQGLLRPPLPPKTDRWFTRSGGAYVLAGAGVVPPDHGRGRQVQWVDADGDGELELYVGSLGSPNRLLERRADGTFVDRASELEIDFEGGATFVWLDVDRDGRDDVVFEDERTLAVALARGPAFERAAAGALGLALPDVERGPGVLDQPSMRVLDVDGDGELDVLVTELGKAKAWCVLLRRGERFSDATAELGLAHLPPLDPVCVLDVELDGDLDFVGLGTTPLLLESAGGSEFVARRLDAAREAGEVNAATAADLDGDGLDDLALVGRERRLVLRNRSAVAVTPLRVRIRDSRSIGAELRIVHADGSVTCSRVGSAHATGLSQVLRDLVIGWTPGNPPVRVDVRDPGGRTRSLEVPARGEGAGFLDVVLDR